MLLGGKKKHHQVCERQSTPTGTNWALVQGRIQESRQVSFSQANPQRTFYLHASQFACLSGNTGHMSQDLRIGHFTDGFELLLS